MMPTCKMNETKLEVNENYEEADLSDVEDDVFVRGGGRNGYRTEYDTAKKPLMTPRKKMYGFDNIKNGGLHTDIRSSPPALRVLCMPICYIIIATFAMLGLIAVITFLTSYVSWPLSMLNLWKKVDAPVDSENLIPCDKIQVEEVWVRQFPKLLTESAFRLIDTNKDGIEDIVFGYATGADGYDVPEFVCDIYFGGQTPCFGGVLALDGKDGKELWRHWTAHEVFALNCNEDLNQDGIHDCLVAGRAGVFCALNGKDGSVFWKFEDGPGKLPTMNIYTPQYVRDLNNDGIIDILAVHGGDPLAEPGSKTRLSGRIILLSGKDGQVLQWVTTPDKKESYYSPQILTRPDGMDLVLFGTGGETHGGGLYVIPITDLYKGLIENAKAIYVDENKGIMVPPVITDITGDGIDDIVMAMFNSTVVAFDGNSFQQLWNYSFPSSETYTTPTPGYFNDDSIPDFLVKYQTGPGFPIYYHAQTTVLDGKTGKPLLAKPIIDSIGSQSSTPLIRFEGYGNDIFLYWSSNCKGFEGNSTEFSFVKGTSVHEQSRADFCRIRFDTKSKLINQLRAFNYAIGLPGIVIYDSESRSSVEYNSTLNTSQEGQAYLQAHPEMWRYFDQQQYKSSKDSSSAAFMGASVAESDLIPQYPASSAGSSDGSYLPPGISYPGVGLGQSIYDMSSQPETTEDVKYPLYHNVRKHGKYSIPVAVANGPGERVDMTNGELNNLNININRRHHQETGNNNIPVNNDGEAWSNYYRRGSGFLPGPNRVGLVHGGKGNYASVNNDPYEKTEDGLGRARERFSGYLPSEAEAVAAAALERENSAYPQWKSDNDYRRSQRRAKRHIGPHDEDGIQRLISTGTLAKPLNASYIGDGIDLVFATYWFFPAKTQAILPKDRDCIQEKMSQESQRINERSKYYGMDHDEYQDAVTNECLQDSQSTPADEAQQPSSSSSTSSSQNQQNQNSQSQLYESQSTYNPFDIHMGQMTVYRLHITCTCSGTSRKVSPEQKEKAPLKSANSTPSTTESQQKCANILPWKDQPWSAYMGYHADSYFPFPINTQTPTSFPNLKSSSQGGGR